MSTNPLPSRAVPHGARPGRPSCRWCRAGGRRPRPGPGAIAAYRSRVASLSTAPDASSTPQWPWSVNSSRHRSDISTVSSPSSACRRCSATLSTPSGSSAPEPIASLSLGHAEDHQPADAGRDRPRPPPSPGSPSVCCTTPGIERDRRRGSAMPSRTNIGSTRSDGRTSISLTSRRSAAVRRSRRGREVGNGGSSGRLTPQDYAGFGDVGSL